LVEDTQATVSRLVVALAQGDRKALDALFPLVYDEVHALAHRHRRRWQGDETLNTTALVHEAYLKLAHRDHLGVDGRAHFLALAARAMRQILINHAEAQQARKRGGNLRRVSLTAAGVPGDRDESAEDEADILVALDAALRQLAMLHARQARVVECRFFGGLTIEETAAALGVAPRTVKRDWAVAQAWLHARLDGTG